MKDLSKKDIIRAWKDEEYRNSLSESERAQLPENPAGAIELPDEVLASAAGGTVLTPLTAGMITETGGNYPECAEPSTNENGPRCCGCSL